MFRLGYIGLITTAPESLTSIQGLIREVYIVNDNIEGLTEKSDH